MRQCLNGNLKVTETLQYVYRYIIHTNMTSQSIIYPKPNPNLKNNHEFTPKF